ncbi:MAG: preprotein translocase subunit SecE [Caulobacteraceae bacterium]|nr:preprotein translocase subunit SecE [Caulobacteraceae bacterium]
MAKDQGIVQTALRRRTPLAVSPSGAGGPPAAAAKKRVGPIQFLREVRAEARKVTWTSWKETWITSIMVGIMVIMTALFFFGVDWILGLGISGVLRLASAE